MDTELFLFPILNLQNGALTDWFFDPNGKVIQFLSYEGSFTATNGPANGMTSTDIGITEESNAAVGSSLQLIGAGFMPILHGNQLQLLTMP
jgi:hypothetical protein